MVITKTISAAARRTAFSPGGPGSRPGSLPGQGPGELGEWGRGKTGPYTAAGPKIRGGGDRPDHG